MHTAVSTVDRPAVYGHYTTIVYIGTIYLKIQYSYHRLAQYWQCMHTTFNNYSDCQFTHL